MPKIGTSSNKYRFPATPKAKFALIYDENSRISFESKPGLRLSYNKRKQDMEKLKKEDLRREGEAAQLNLLTDLKKNCNIGFCIERDKSNSNMSFSNLNQSIFERHLIEEAKTVNKKQPNFLAFSTVNSIANFNNIEDSSEDMKNEIKKRLLEESLKKIENLIRNIQLWKTDFNNAVKDLELFCPSDKIKLLKADFNKAFKNFDKEI